MKPTFWISYPSLSSKSSQKKEKIRCGLIINNLPYVFIHTVYALTHKYLKAQHKVHSFKNVIMPTIL